MAFNLERRDPEKGNSNMDKLFKSLVNPQTKYVRVKLQAAFFRLKELT